MTERDRLKFLLRAEGIGSAADFEGRYGVPLAGLSPTIALLVIRFGGVDAVEADTPLVATYSADEWIALRTLDRWQQSGILLGLPAHVELPGYFSDKAQLLSRASCYLDDARRSDEYRGNALRWIIAVVDYLTPHIQVIAA